MFLISVVVRTFSVNCSVDSVLFVWVLTKHSSFQIWSLMAFQYSSAGLKEQQTKCLIASLRYCGGHYPIDKAFFLAGDACRDVDWKGEAFVLLNRCGGGGMVNIHLTPDTLINSHFSPHPPQIPWYQRGYRRWRRHDGLGWLHAHWHSHGFPPTHCPGLFHFFLFPPPPPAPHSHFVKPNHLWNLIHLPFLQC